MKKLGTPSGAGPGSANENVGFAVVGTPGPVGPDVFGLTGFGLDFLWVLCLEFFFVAVLVLLVMSWPLELPGFLNPDELVECWPLLWELPEPPEEEWCDGVVLVVVVVVVVGVVVRDGVVVVTVTVGVVLVEGWQLAVTFETGGVPGGSICAGGVPGAALTVKVSVCPSSSVAVTVQVSAEAAGIAAMAMVPRTTATVEMAIFSLRLIDTVVSISSRHDLGRTECTGAARQGR
jgi:hypothetical protein